jgi:hypothetical protein
MDFTLVIGTDLLLLALPFVLYPQWLERLLASHYVFAAVLGAEIRLGLFAAEVCIRSRTV